MRHLITPIVAVLLNGCWWAGPVFYEPGPDVAKPFISGSYEITGENDPGSHVHLQLQPDGSYLDNDGDRLVFAPFDAGNRKVWIAETIFDHSPGEAAYGLAEQRGSAFDFEPIVDCEDTETIVRAVGGRISSNDQSMGGPVCEFNTREQLEAAVRAYLAAHLRLTDTVELKYDGS